MRLTLLVVIAAMLPVAPDDPPASPYGLAPITWPTENPWSAEAEALGKRLFFDKALSIDNTISCASCHDPDHGFSSREALPPGAQGKRALRHAPTLLNRAYGKTMMWDGRRSGLEEQVLDPISNPNEMALPLEDAIKRLRADREYPALFEVAYGEAPSSKTVARALSTYVRTLLIGNSPVDRFHGGDANALNAEEKAGLWIYESKGGCWRCHSGPNFTDEKFHNTGVGVKDEKPEPGRAAVTNEDGDLGRFKTPTLRGLTKTAPYMHDGSQKTLKDVVEFYRRGGDANPNLDPDMRKLDLTDDDVKNLVAFLKALSRE